MVKVKRAVEDLEYKIDGLEGRLAKINSWCNAYPLDIFPEPDFEKANELLKAGGMNLGAISASNMRHVLEGIKKLSDINEGDQ